AESPWTGALKLTTLDHQAVLHIDDQLSVTADNSADAELQTDTPTLWSRGSREHEIVELLTPLSDELVIDKNASSPFNGTGIDQLLRNLELETLVIVGMATDMCVETTARDAADRGYNVIVAEDATATFFAADHRAALSAVARVYGQVWSTDDILQQLTH
ncbi:MAG: isochorismatase family cysteine hydrolase, partial [Pirellulaceae bacterium]|nr:isochorismatase family cysteine hydrolase [Pirellulaceae bacterium]